MKKPEHLALPLSLGGYGQVQDVNNDHPIVSGLALANGCAGHEPREKTAYILHCVNHHHKLVEALEKIKNGVRHDTECCSVNGMNPYLCDCQRGSTMTIITDALKLARGDG